MGTTFLYNPDRKTKQALIAEFVVRTGIYEEVLHDLESSKMDHPEQHYLLVGQRGTGKTTLLNRIKYGIEDSAALQQKVIPVLFSEEQYHISELANLWEAIGQYLEDYQGFDGLYEEMEAHADKVHYEEKSYKILEKHLQEKGKKLVLLIDNIGDLLKKMGKTEVHRLREILQTKSEIRLIAGSPFYLETVLDYQQPLFEFFKVMRLDGLNRQETQELLLQLAALNGEEEKIKKIIAETPERIETLRTLTGGIPRTIALMFSVFVEYNNEETIKDLERILDAVTPLYKHRMDDLPTQQQKIIDAVAKNWDGISVKELKEKVRIDSKIISAQLQQLWKNQIIEKVETDSKNHIYFLKERFFNIWYLMRYGRKQDRQRVIWLVRFLESWCTTLEIEQRIVDYIQKFQAGKLDEFSISFYGQVYTAMNNIRCEVKILLKESTPQHLSKNIMIRNEEIALTAGEKLKAKEYDQAINLFKKIEQPDEKTAQLVGLHLSLFALENAEYFGGLIEKVKTELENKQPDKVSFYQIILPLVYAHSVCAYCLAHKQYEAAHQCLLTLLDSATLFESITDKGIDFMVNYTLENFLLFEQAKVVLSIFQNFPKWIDKLKPTYYATLRVLGMDHEFAKMGPELRNSVEDILKQLSINKANMKSGA